MAGRGAASWPGAASRPAAARAIASAMITSVASGRWGPCASTAPTGTIATVFVRSRSRTSSQVRCARSRTAMGGCMVPGAAVDRQRSTADICHDELPAARAVQHRRLRSEEHTSELQSLAYLVCRLLLEKKKTIVMRHYAVERNNLASC